MNKITWLILITLALFIKVFSLFPDAVERYYSNGAYPVIARWQRLLFGWIPFSVGDIFYAIAITYVLSIIYRVSKKILRRNFSGKYIWYGIRKLVAIGLGVYVLFNLLWGLNYNRIGMAGRFDRQMHYSTDELTAVMRQLISRLNSMEGAARLGRDSLVKKKKVFATAIRAYARLGDAEPSYKYSSVSLKPSLFSYLGNYMGFTGYYNPFSGEAQVNTTVPPFIQPFTTCHEIGHQLGYAKESEANFMAFLSGRASKEPAVKYSVYFDLYYYGRRYLYATDSLQALRLDSLLAPGIRQDYKQLQDFWRRHANPVEQVVDFVYDSYLRANQQPSGRVSYSEVILWLVAYYRKTGSV